MAPFYTRKPNVCPKTGSGRIGKLSKRTFLQAATGSRVTTPSLIGVRRMATRGGSAQTITTTGTRWILSARCLGGRRSTADPSDGTIQSKRLPAPASAMLPPTAAYLAQLIVLSGDSVDSLPGCSPHLTCLWRRSHSFLMTGGAGCNSMEPGKRCPGMTETEYRTEFSLWTIGAASMIVSTARKRLFALFYSSKR